MDRTLRLIGVDPGSVTLAGTVVLPPPGTPVRAAAVVITGSGPLDRDANHRRAPPNTSREIARQLESSR